MVRNYLLVLLSIAVLSSKGQDKPVQLGATASDCLGALMLNDTVIGPVYSPKGFGKKLEINGYELGDPYYIEREHNTVWYKFVAPYDAILSFDLIPKVAEDDFDFLLYQYDGPNFCADISAGRKIPIRTNISRKNVYMGGMTGLSEGSIDEYVPSGPGSSYSKPVKVEKGELYYILVDNPFKENEGHSIQLHFRRVGEKRLEVEKISEERKIPYRKLEVIVKDASNGERIPSEIHVMGLPDSVQSRYPSVSRVALDVISYRTYQVNVVKKGYLFSTVPFIPKNDSLYTINVDLQPMKLGDRINLENIKFEVDDTQILEKSLPALDQLVDFMQINPTTRVDIQGHVNGEGGKNKRSHVKLSEARAQAIYDELVKRGVSESRMTYQGFGSANMKYPTPVNNSQAEANRRVEIEITAL